MRTLGTVGLLVLLALALALAPAGAAAGDAEMAKGKEAFQIGDYAKAADWFEKAARKRPKDANARLWLGAAYYRMGQREPARQEFEAARKLGAGTSAEQQALEYLRSLGAAPATPAASSQVRSTYKYPAYLTRRGAEKLPPMPDPPRQFPMVSTEAESAAAFSKAFQALERRFGMTFARPVRTVTNSAMDDPVNRVIGSPGDRPEDEFVVIAAHEAAHVWHYDQIGDAFFQSKAFKEGFGQWIQLKIALSEGYVEQAHYADITRKTGEWARGFVKLREIEETSGELGVFQFVLNPANARTVTRLDGPLRVAGEWCR